MLELLDFDSTPAPTPEATSTVDKSPDLERIRRLVEHVPSELKTLNVWVLLLDNLDGDEPFIIGRDGDPAYVDQPGTWLGFNEALELLAESDDCRLGFALSPDHDYTAIEWWAIVRPNGELSPPNCRDWIHFIDSYTEKTDEQHLLTIIKGRPPEKVDDGPGLYDDTDISTLVPEITTDSGFVPISGEVVLELNLIREISALAGRLLRGLADDPLKTTENIDATWQTTEGWAARFFITSFGGELRYCVEEEAWYCWDGQHWQGDDIDRIYTEYWDQFLNCELRTFAHLVPDIVPGRHQDINDPSVQAWLEEFRQAQSEESGAGMSKLMDLADHLRRHLLDRGERMPAVAIAPLAVQHRPHRATYLHTRPPLAMRSSSIASFWVRVICFGLESLTPSQQPVAPGRYRLARIIHG